MKRHLASAFAAATFSLLALSCTGNFEEINYNHNKIYYGDAAASSLFEPLVYGIGTNNQYQAWFFANELVQVTAFTGGQTTQIHQYQIPDGNWQTQWDVFARFGFDAHHLIDRAVATGDRYMEALGRIFKVYCLSNLSALFGDIPYEEAYMQQENTTPVFDSQVRLAEEFIADLDSAVVLLRKKPAVSKKGLDRMYSDNYTSWIKFACSLRMRILCRMSGIGDSYWQAIQDMVDDPAAWPVFASNADNAVIPFGDADPYRNYWGQQNTTSDNFTAHRITQTMIDMMVEFNAAGNSVFEDPRLPIYATQRSGAWKGSRGGITNDEFKAWDTGSALPNYSVLARSSMPAFLMDYSEVLFILAEGVLNGKLSVGKTAKELYEEAVRASIAKWAEFGQYAAKPVTVRSSDIALLLSGPLGSWDKAAAGDGTSIYGSTEELLGCQKFISLYFCGYEVYNEWRRTEYPDFEIADGTSSNGYELPTRFGYPNYTVASNSANVSAALERMGGAGAVNNMHIPLDWSYVKLNGTHRSPHPFQQ